MRHRWFWRWALVRLVFIAVPDLADSPGGSRPRVLRRLSLAPRSAWSGLVPIRYPAARRMLRTPVSGPLPMRSGWLKPAIEVLVGAHWSEWCALGSIACRPWPHAP